MKMNVERANALVFERVAAWLNAYPCRMEIAEVRSLAQSCGVPDDYAYAMLLTYACGFDPDANLGDREIFHRWFVPMVHKLEPERYAANAYLANICFPQADFENWKFEVQRYRAGEAFVMDDVEICADGRVIPQIGYFETEFSYPSVLEDGRLWMTVTPNEIETMQPAIDCANGNVLTYGLGLGYFAYMTLRKAEVTSLTIVERSAAAIRLFREKLLPQFPHPEKIRILNRDAFEYAREIRHGQEYDFVFADIWHDVLDGTPMYLKFKALEGKHARYMYWIEKSIRCGL